jgi:hypothetical protein
MCARAYHHTSRTGGRLPALLVIQHTGPFHDSVFRPRNTKQRVLSTERVGGCSVTESVLTL